MCGSKELSEKEKKKTHFIHSDKTNFGILGKLASH